MAALELPKNTLGVYLNCHGIISPKFTIATSPSKLTITKQNLSGMGCPSYTIDRRIKSTMPQEYEIALSLTKDMRICLTPEMYSMLAHSQADVDKYGDKIDETNYLCEQFTTRQWVAKIYDMTKGKIVFALNGHIFDLIDGFPTFILFLIKLGDFREDAVILHQVLSELESNFPSVSNPNIRTETLFHMMRAIQLHTQITHVNMLDETCNVNIDTTQKPIEKLNTKTGKMELRPVLIARDKIPRLPPSVGYGGTRKNKKYNRKSRFRAK